MASSDTTRHRTTSTDRADHDHRSLDQHGGVRSTAVDDLRLVATTVSLCEPQTMIMTCYGGLFDVSRDQGSGGAVLPASSRIGRCS
jgi:hypothetical protein